MSKTPTMRSWTKVTRSKTRGGVEVWRCGCLDEQTRPHFFPSTRPCIRRCIAPIGTARSGHFFICNSICISPHCRRDRDRCGPRLARPSRRSPLVVSPLRGFLPLFRPALSFVHRLLCRLGFSLFLPLVLLVPAFIVVDVVDGETQRELRNSPVSCDGVLRNLKRNDAACEGWIRRPRRGS